MKLFEENIIDDENCFTNLCLDPINQQASQGQMAKYQNCFEFVGLGAFGSQMVLDYRRGSIPG